MIAGRELFAAYQGTWHYLKPVRLGNVCCRTLREVRYAVRLATAILRHKATMLENLPQYYGFPQTHVYSST